jgi:hypothetical protein
MDLHKPKPWHGGAEFIKEIGTIVIGVLIALGAEQAVEWLHNRDSVAETREALRAEAATNVGATRFALQEDRCYLKALDMYEAWARGAPKPEVPYISAPGPMDTVWETAKSGAVTHMPLKEKLGWARLYAGVSNIRALGMQQRTQGQQVRGYLGLDSLETPEARSLIREVRTYRGIMTGKLFNEQRFLVEAKALGVVSSPFGGYLTKDNVANLERLCRFVGEKPDLSS